MSGSWSGSTMRSSRPQAQAPCPHRPRHAAPVVARRRSPARRTNVPMRGRRRDRWCCRPDAGSRRPGAQHPADLVDALPHGLADDRRGRSAASAPGRGSPRRPRRPAAPRPAVDHRRDHPAPVQLRQQLQVAAPRTAPAPRPGRAARTARATGPTDADRHRAVDHQCLPHGLLARRRPAAAARTARARTQASGSGSRSSRASHLAVVGAAELGPRTRARHRRSTSSPACVLQPRRRRRRSPAARASVAQRHLAAAVRPRPARGRSRRPRRPRAPARSASGDHSSAASAARRRYGSIDRLRRLDAQHAGAGSAPPRRRSPRR